MYERNSIETNETEFIEIDSDYEPETSPLNAEKQKREKDKLDSKRRLELYLEQKRLEKELSEY